MFFNYCTYACRTLVFLFVVFVVGYVIIKNDQKIENFVDNIAGTPIKLSDTQKETINVVVRNYLNREANASDYALFSKVMSNPNDVLSVVEAVKATDEYRQLYLNNSKKTDHQDKVILDASNIVSSPLIKDLQKVDFDSRMEVYRKVIDVYQKALERMPTNKELAYYSHRILTDEAFSINKLALVLEGSNEYHILQKNQVNVVNGQLPGNLTDAQLEMDIIGKYKSIFAKEPNEATLIFLKEKFLDYRLDEIKFHNLLVLMKQIDDDHLVDSEDGLVAFTKTQNSKHKLETKSLLTQSQQQNQTDGSNVYNNAKIINIITPSTNDIDDIVKRLKESDADGNPAIINNRTLTSDKSNDALQTSDKYTDPFYKKLAQNKLKCKFDTNTPYDRDALTIYKTKRNNDEIDFACGRNKYFMDLDPDIVKVGYSKKDYRKQNVEFNAKPVEYSYEPNESTPLADLPSTYINPNAHFGI